MGETRFHKNKIYRVVQKTDRRGRTAYQVEAAGNKWEALLGLWTEYIKQNSSLDEAIEQIQDIDGYRSVSETIVHREKRK